MKMRFYNARILTMKNRDVIEGELHTDGDKITYVGPLTNGGDFDKEIDCGGDLLMPGFKNAHTHTAMTFARSLSDEYQLDDWLHKAIFPREAKLTADHVYWLSKLGFAEYLSGGVTSCFDMYFELDAQAKAASESGFRNVFCGSVNDFGGIDHLESDYEKFNSGDPLISHMLGFHAEYTTSMDLMKTISMIANKHQAPVFTHISETKAEVEGCVERYGKSPVILLDELGMFDYGGGGFHCVWFDDKDIEVFKKHNLTAVLNAGSNLKLASGIAPAAKYVREGLNIALGTDGAGSNNGLDMFREMYMSEVLSNVVENNAAAIDPWNILKGATVGGANAMGLSNCDVLDVGKQADFIRINMMDPSMQPINNIVNNLVYSGSKNIVKMTVIAGKILYEDGKYNSIDLEKVIYNCNNIMEQLR